MLIVDKYAEKLSSYTEGNKNIFFYWKGRVALYAILKSMGVQEGDEVIVPAFTCVVVPNAILYCGAKPIYVDIDPDTYNMDLLKLELAISKNTKVILCQNTFGLSSGINEIMLIAKKNNLYTIEDCTHGFGGTYNGKKNGVNCDAAFYSTQWNKPFSTGIGGFALINNNDILNNIKSLEVYKSKPEIIDNAKLLVLILIKKIILNNFTYWFLLRLYRLLSKYNIVIGSSTDEELNSVDMPVKFFKGMSFVQMFFGIHELKKLDFLIKRRKQNASKYTEFLLKMNRKHVSSIYFSDHSFLKYPVLVKNRNEFIRLAKINNIEIGEWFLSPLHPIETDLTKWHFDCEKFPIAQEISSRIVNLPLEKNDINNVIAFLENHIEFVL